MLEDFIFCEDPTGETLDGYLSKGYYRMHQFVFTTDWIHLDNTLYPVFWLRTNLQKVQWGKTAQRIRKLNSAFETTVKPYAITPETEELYHAYRGSINFDAPHAIRDFLHHDIPINVFDTGMIEVRHNGALIAVGYFDMGKQAMAGIMNFYHPRYKSHSLGKYLMLVKISYAQQLGLRYYYPGYFSTRRNKFDYKVFPNAEAMEVYIRATGQWLPYAGVTYRQLEEWLPDNGIVQQPAP